MDIKHVLKNKILIYYSWGPDGDRANSCMTLSMASLDPELPRDRPRSIGDQLAHGENTARSDFVEESL